MSYLCFQGAEIIKARAKSSAASAANAVCDHIYDLFHGTKPGQYANMAVLSDTNCYGVPSGIYFSFPCTIEKGGK